MISVQKLVQAIDQLKPLPQVVSHLVKIADDPQASMRDIADIITHDPLITADLLRMCNSAYFGLPRKIESVQEAITLLGLEKVVNLVLIKCCRANLGRAQQGYGHQEGELWRHAVSTALISGDLAERLATEARPRIFTGALLKDIGKVILDRFVAEAFDMIDNLVKTQGMSFKTAEKKVIGVDHAELGAIVAKKWQFSDKLVAIIQHHHLDCPTARDDLETNLVYLGDTVGMMLGLGGGSDGLAYHFYGDTLKRLKISSQDIQEIIMGFSEHQAKIDILLAVA
jgi:putative nucleotidyltransferase with HDIG domain